MKRMEPQKTVSFVLRLPPDVYKKVVQEAAQHKESINRFLNYVIGNYVRRIKDGK